MTRKRAGILLAMVALALSLVMCDIAGTGEGIIEGGQEAVEFAEEARAVLEPMIKQLGEDGLSLTKYVGTVGECLKDGGSNEECFAEARLEALADCQAKGHSYEHCAERYGE